MSDAVQIALITALATAIPIMFQHWLSQRALRQQLGQVKDDVKEIEKATNSMKDALIQTTKEASLLAGHAQGVKDEKIFQADKAIGDTLLTKAATAANPVPVKDEHLAQVIKEVAEGKDSK